MKQKQLHIGGAKTFGARCTKNKKCYRRCGVLIHNIGLCLAEKTSEIKQNIIWDLWGDVHPSHGDLQTQKKIFKIKNHANHEYANVFTLLPLPSLILSKSWIFPWGTVYTKHRPLFQVIQLSITYASAAFLTVRCVPWMWICELIGVK